MFQQPPLPAEVAAHIASIPAKVERNGRSKFSMTAARRQHFARRFAWWRNQPDEVRAVTTSPACGYAFQPYVDLVDAIEDVFRSIGR